MVEIGVEIEAGRLEMGSILTNDTGISSGMIALVVYARGLGLNRRYRLVPREKALWAKSDLD